MENQLILLMALSVFVKAFSVKFSVVPKEVHNVHNHCVASFMNKLMSKAI